MGNSRFIMEATTEDDSFSLDIEFTNALPFISFDSDYVKDTTILTSKGTPTPKVKLNDEHEYIASVKSPYSGKVASIYYSKEKKVLFLIPSLDWCKNYANRPNKLNHKIYGHIIGVYGENFVDNQNILLQQGLYTTDIILYYDNKPTITPELTVNNISSDGLLTTAGSYRVSVENLTMLNSIPVNLIKLGVANKINGGNLPIFRNIFTDLRNYNTIKYLGSINSTEDVYIALIF